MQVGDVLLGLASSGPHSNGYSLVRKIVERSGLSYHDAAPFETTASSLGAALLTPTRIYVKPLLAALAAAPGAIKGLAHITGGGLVENIPRALPKHLTALVDVASWTLPPVFRWLKKTGGVTGAEMGRAFNTGIGMTIIVGKEDVERVKSLLEEKGEKVFVVGELATRGEDEGCVLKNLESWE
ncbi:bifunctional purine biosynthetic protein Ade1 [Blastomyces silverae]|uniref:phosphoribosylformylglycinamidine cyclo-ligase n=1 Tax=Blastomyces silverae TaxID=2060906 RepID=A0A0H1B8P6_9EURO|nr:bifunctional purine biosynthetic protein Ade1 [Blastomyces silverae]